MADDDSRKLMFVSPCQPIWSDQRRESGLYSRRRDMIAGERRLSLREMAAGVFGEPGA